MKKLLSLTLALATLSATCYAEQPKAADYRNIMSSGNYYVEYEYNYAKKDSCNAERQAYGLYNAAKPA